MVDIHTLIRYGKNYDGLWVQTQGKPTMLSKGKTYTVYALRDSKGNFLHVLDFTAAQPKQARKVEGVYIATMHLLICWR